MRLRSIASLLSFLSLLSFPSEAQTLDPALVLEREQLKDLHDALDHGIYERALRACDYLIDSGAKLPDWHHAKVECLLAMGRSTDALAACKAATELHTTDIPLRELEARTLQQLGQSATTTLQTLNDLIRAKPAKDRTLDDLIAIASTATMAGADPQKVIQQYLVLAKKLDDKSAKPYLAIADLALDHHDAARAAKELQAGLKAHGESPALRFGLARAFVEGDRSESAKHLARVLETNPHHEPALTLTAQQALAAEKFDVAEAALTTALETNPQSPRAHALLSVIATLRDNDIAKAAEHRAQALQRWAQDPQVDHLIGQCLSHAYRFVEGAQCQREVIALAPNFAPAKLQLAHDLMRLGQLDEAWKLAAEVRAADAYNAHAHNLGILEQQMATYHREQQSDFILRMTERDWAVYGPRALALLREAKGVLTAKYEHSFTKPVMVEFFPSQQDFAIRTFGSLGGQGLLGVCFGSVVTMNSPGSLAHARSNWERTLWHEFTHVVTLGVTHNRMPRWLSEGLSVYEEQQRDPSWGMKMTAEYRRMILDDDKATPLSEMSSAFLNAETSEDTMFAYFESSVAVTWLIEKHGWKAFRALLAELATGTRINEAIAKHLAPMDQIEPAFAEHLTSLAKAYAPKADWSKPESTDWKAELEKSPTNLAALHTAAEAALNTKRWPDLIKVADQLIAIEPENTDDHSGYWLKAQALHALDRLPEETTLLRDIAARDADAQSAFNRLLDLDLKANDWPHVQENAKRVFALNPFLNAPNEALAQACEALNQTDAAIEHHQRVLTLKPTQPAVTRYKLAGLLRTKDLPQAKRHLLDALVIAPRYRDAQQLLLDMQK